MSAEDSFARKTEKGPIERLAVVVDSKEEAIQLVRDFWNVMPHGNDVVRTVAHSGEDWTQELTAGDRTRILDGSLSAPRHPGKWNVIFRGNSQPISKEAIAWLQGKGLI